jgi:hypothetical protein
LKFLLGNRYEDPYAPDDNSRAPFTAGTCTISIVPSHFEPIRNKPVIEDALRGFFSWRSSADFTRHTFEYDRGRQEGPLPTKNEMLKICLERVSAVSLAHHLAAVGEYKSVQAAFAAIGRALKDIAAAEAAPSAKDALRNEHFSALR